MGQALLLSSAEVFRLADGSPKLARSPARWPRDTRETIDNTSGEMPRIANARCLRDGQAAAANAARNTTCKKSGATACKKADKQTGKRDCPQDANPADNMACGMAANASRSATDNTRRLQEASRHDRREISHEGWQDKMNTSGSTVCGIAVMLPTIRLAGRLSGRAQGNPQGRSAGRSRLILRHFPPLIAQSSLRKQPRRNLRRTRCRKAANFSSRA